MAKKIALYLFAILFSITITSAEPEITTGELSDKFLIVIHKDADSLYAQQAKDIVYRYYEEIADDIQLEQHDSLFIYIAPSRRDFRNYLKGNLPQWTGAFATPARNSMYIRSPRWDKDNDFKATIIHELFHLLIHQKMQGLDIPRWLEEGLAIFYSGEKRWITSTSLSKALATNSLIPLAQIDRVLKFHRAKAELAYQESYSATQYLLATYDVDALRTILSGIAAGYDLDTCFKNATGSTFQIFEREWIVNAKQKYHWFWLSDLDDYLWIFIIIIFLVVGIFVRWRNRKKLQEWENETEFE